MRLALLSLLLLVPASAIAAEKIEAPKEEKKICKREGATESRLRSKRICRTAAEWKRASQSGEDFDLRMNAGKVR